MMILLKIFLVILAIEAVSVGVALMVLLKMISYCHKVEEEGMLNEGDRLSEED